MKRPKFADDEHTKFVYPPSVPINFPQSQKSFPSVLPKNGYQVPLRMYSKTFQRKFAKNKKHYVTKFENEFLLLFLKRINWKQRRDVLASKKWLQLIKVNTVPAINLLS